MNRAQISHDAETYVPIDMSLIGKMKYVFEHACSLWESTPFCGSRTPQDSRLSLSLSAITTSFAAPGAMTLAEPS